MIEYQHDVKKFAIGGLQLNLPPDLVPEKQYSLLDNAVSRIEGRLETRDGSVVVCTIGVAPIHSIFRLNQQIPHVIGERLFGTGSSLFTAPLPAGNLPSQLTAYMVQGVSYPAFPVGFNGRPLSMAAFRFDGDPQSWVIIANGGKMMKRKDQYYEQLGLPAPTVQPVAAAGGAGLLNGSYQWRYTYINEVTGSESNPSDVSTTAAPTGITVRPTTFTNPSDAAAFAFTNPGNAFDGNLADFAEGSMSVGQQGSVACRWFGFPAATPGYGGFFLNVDYEGSVVAGSGVLGRSSAGIQYSLDGGATWTAISQITSARPNNFTPPPVVTANRQTYAIRLPDGQDLTLVQVRGLGAQGGGFGLSGTTDMKVYDIIIGENPTNITGLPLVNQSATVCVAPPVDPQETAIRLYRIGGTLPDAYRLISQSRVTDLVQGMCGAGTLEIDDNVADAAITASAVLETDNDMPVDSVQATNLPIDSIWPFDERLLGVGDPNRPDVVYFSKRGNADEWPSQNFVDVCDPGDEMMLGLTWALRCFTFSREGLFQLIPNITPGITFTPAKTSCRRGVKGKKAACLGSKGIYFIAKDGIFRTVGSEEQPVHGDIGPIFPTRDGPGRTVGTYEGVNMDDEDGLRLEFHNNEIWFDYTGKDTGTRRRLVFSEDLNRWRSELYAVPAQMAYSELATDSSLLSGLIDGTIRQGSAVLEGNVTVNAQTGAYDQGKPLNLKEYANVVFDLDTGGADISITPYINGNQTAAPTLTVPAGSGRVRVALSLQDVFALNMSFLTSWIATVAKLPILYQMDILYRIEPAAMQHWQIPAYSLGAKGWFHMRDAYVTLRSASDVTLTVTPDNGASFALIIPSTAGKKMKAYLRFPPNKAKLADFSIDSTADFRLYQDECELRAKPWAQPLGYQVIPLFGAEQQ